MVFTHHHTVQINATVGENPPKRTNKHAPRAVHSTMHKERDTARVSVANTICERNRAHCTAHHHRSARAPRRYLDGRDDVEVCASDHRHPVDRRDDVTRAQPSTSSQRPLLDRHNRRTVAKGATSDERDADPLVLQNEERGVVGMVVGVHVVLQNEERGCSGYGCWCACCIAERRERVRWVWLLVCMLKAGCVNGPTLSTSQAGCEEQDPQTSGVQVSRCRDECRATKSTLLQHQLVRRCQGVLRLTSPSPDCVMPLDKCCTSPARSIARENSSPAVASICLASPRDLSAIDRPLT
jgi:hypothetical protein